jgi:hypothetical protein
MTFKLTNLSEAENNARLAAAVTSYGVGTKSYNSSAEKRESDRQRAEATAKWEASSRREVEVIRCHCRSFNLSHDLSRHNELRGEWDWRLESERRGVQRYQEAIR